MGHPNEQHNCDRDDNLRQQAEPKRWLPKQVQRIDTEQQVLDELEGEEGQDLGCDEGAGVAAGGLATAACEGSTTGRPIWRCRRSL